MKFVNRTNHATKDCRFKSNFKSCQPWSRVQAHLIEEEMNDDEYIVEYQCIMIVFTLSSLSAQVRAIYVNRIKGRCPK